MASRLMRSCRRSISVADAPATVLELDDVFVLVANEVVSDFGRLGSILEGFASRKKSLAIVARDVSRSRARGACPQSARTWTAHRCVEADRRLRAGRRSSGRSGLRHRRLAHWCRGGPRPRLGQAGDARPRAASAFREGQGAVYRSQRGSDGDRTAASPIGSRGRARALSLLRSGACSASLGAACRRVERNPRRRPHHVRCIRPSSSRPGPRWRRSRPPSDRASWPAAAARSFEKLRACWRRRRGRQPPRVQRAGAWLSG